MPAVKPKLDPNDPITKQLLAALAYKQKFAKIEQLFPDKGKCRRSLYPKHLLHFKKGATYNQRLLMAANQVGKTTAAGAEIVYHLTGKYPKWWEGKVFHSPQDWWVVGETAQSVASVLQNALLGPIGEFGSGLIPRDALDLQSMVAAKKMETYVGQFRVKHISGGWSTVEFKSYDQGRRSFQGTVKSIWLDEEPPKDIYDECLMRTINNTAAGEENILMMTFTPLRGYDVDGSVATFLGPDRDYKDGEKGPGKWKTGAEWTDVPHLSKVKQAELLASYSPHLRDARSKGIPVLGEGAVYPVPEERVFIDAFPIPEHFRRCFSMDFGFQDPTAILWGALDPETECWYIYAESYLREQPPMIHAGIIEAQKKAAGFTIPGVCDPSGGGSSTADGKLTRDIYKDEYGIKMKSAINSIEPGITTVLDLIVKDHLKIFRTCLNTKREFGSYQRNKKGTPVGDDHAMDCLRYLVMSGGSIAKSLKQIQDAKLAENKTYESQYLPSWSRYFNGGR